MTELRNLLKDHAVKKWSETRDRSSVQSKFFYC